MEAMTKTVRRHYRRRIGTDVPLEERFIQKSEVNGEGKRPAEYDKGSIGDKDYLFHQTPIGDGTEITDAYRILGTNTDGFRVEEATSEEFDILNQMYAKDTGIKETGCAVPRDGDFSSRTGTHKVGGGYQRNSHVSSIS